MLIKLNNKGQNTAEYALLIALVVAGVIAMQTYSQRALQARVRDASQHMTDKTAKSSDGKTYILGDVAQYEPYYLESSYNTDRKSEEGQVLGENTTADYALTNRVRQDKGFQKSTYKTSGDGSIKKGL